MNMILLSMYLSSLISVDNALQFSFCRYFTFFVGFIPVSQFYSFAIVAFLNFKMLLLLIDKYRIDFCVLIFCPVTLINPLIIVVLFSLVDSIQFYTQTITLSVLKDTLTFHLPFVSFTCFISLASVSSKMWNTVCENRSLCISGVVDGHRILDWLLFFQYFKMSFLCLLAHIVFDGQFLSMFYEEKFVFIGTFVPLCITSSSSLALFLVFYLLLAFRKLIMMCLCAVFFIFLVLGVH